MKLTEENKKTILNTNGNEAKLYIAHALIADPEFMADLDSFLEECGKTIAIN